MLTVEQRIDAGIKLLDSHFGPGWEDRVDLGTLDISSSCKCTLGQLFEQWSWGCAALGITGMESDDFGFDAGAYEREDAEKEYVTLEKAWIKAIKAMRKRRYADQKIQEEVFA